MPPTFRLFSQIGGVALLFFALPIASLQAQNLVVADKGKPELFYKNYNKFSKEAELWISIDVPIIDYVDYLSVQAEGRNIDAQKTVHSKRENHRSTDGTIWVDIHLGKVSEFSNVRRRRKGEHPTKMIIAAYNQSGERVYKGHHSKDLYEITLELIEKNEKNKKYTDSKFWGFFGKITPKQARQMGEKPEEGQENESLPALDKEKDDADEGALPPQEPQQQPEEEQDQKSPKEKDEKPEED